MPIIHAPLPSLPSRSTRWWIIGGFFLVTFLVYGASLTNQFVRWDDGLLIYENPAIRSITPSSLKTIFTTYDPELYIPLTFFSYQIDYLIGGTNATIYHIQNLLWHTLNALLVSWLAFLLTRRGWLALLCGLFFAVHPLHTEAVAWASARKDVLSTFFFLGSLIAYLHFHTDRKRKFYLLSLGAFFLGLLAKVTIIGLPVILLLLDFRNRRTWNLRLWLEKIPFFALSTVFGVIAIFGKTAVLSRSTPLEQLLMATKSTIFYLEKLFLPIRLSVLYPYEGTITIFSPDFFIPISLCAILTVSVLVSLRWTREVLFAVGFFLIAIAPTFLNFAKGNLDLYFASDRYAYVGSIGALFLLMTILGALSQRSRIWWRCIYAGTVITCITFGIMAHAQSAVWKDSESLFTNVLKYYPNTYVALNNTGNAYLRRGQMEEAAAYYRKSLKRKWSAYTLSNLAAVYRSQGRLDDAESLLNQAIAGEPDSKVAYVGLGILEATRGNFEKAYAAYTRALAIDPQFTEAALNRGALNANAGRLEDAVKDYRFALAIDPFFPQTHYNLGVTLVKLSRASEAEDAYREAVRLQPKFTAARLNLGILLYNRRDAEGALEQFDAILQYDPGNAQAQSAIRQIQGQ